MPNNRSGSIDLPTLWEIDGLYFNKAQRILAEAKDRLRDCDYDLAVRRAQEAFELYLKSLFRFLETEYPATHDLKKQIYAVTEALKDYQIDKHRVARLVLANSVLQLWRSPAFYGDETLGVGRLFETSEAELALSYADLGQLVCTIARARVYERTAASQTA